MVAGSTTVARRDAHTASALESTSAWSSAKVCTGDSQNFRATLKISIVMLVVVKQNGIDRIKFSEKKTE